MPNLGDIDVQSIAGAIGTATHGTGPALGNLATTVVGIELVDGTGEVVRCDEHDDPELLRVARVGVGALGVVTEVTLQCVPAFNLHARETIEQLDDVLGRLSSTSAARRPRRVLLDARRRGAARSSATDAPTSRARPQSRLAYVRDKYLAENVGFGLACRVGRRFPSLAPTIAKVVAAALSASAISSTAATASSPARAMCASSRWSTACPLEHLADAVDRVRDLDAHVERSRCCSRSRCACRPPTTSRCRPASAASDGWVAVHQYRGAPYEAYFQGVERIMDELRRPPALGQAALPDGGDAGRALPEWDDFQAARDGSTRPARSATPTSTASSVRDRTAAPLSPHPLAAVLDAAVAGSFPPADGVTELLPPDPWGWSAVVALTGHAYVLADVDARRPRRASAPTATAGRRTPTCCGASPAPAARSARSTRCSSAAARPGRCCRGATTATTTRGCSGRATTGATSRCSATTPGSSSSAAGSPGAARWPSSCSTPPPAAAAGHGRRLIRAGLAALAARRAGVGPGVAGQRPVAARVPGLRVRADRLRGADRPARRRLTPGQRRRAGTLRRCT